MKYLIIYFLLILLYYSNIVDYLFANELNFANITNGTINFEAFYSMTIDINLHYDINYYTYYNQYYNESDYDIDYNKYNINYYNESDCNCYEFIGTSVFNINPDYYIYHDNDYYIQDNWCSTPNCIELLNCSNVDCNNYPDLYIPTISFIQNSSCTVINNTAQNLIPTLFLLIILCLVPLFLFYYFLNSLYSL